MEFQCIEIFAVFNSQVHIIELTIFTNKSIAVIQSAAHYQTKEQIS